MSGMHRPGIVPVVRAARIDDAEGIARMHWASHHETYIEPGLVAREHIEAWTLEQRIAGWRTTVGESLAGGRTIAVAVEGDRIVGFADARPVDRADDPEAPRDLELNGLYLLAAHQGSGLGQRLLDAVIGDEPAFLWALAGETRARAFYRRNGFEPDGAEQVFEPWAVMTVRLVR
ncbi:GNAT family N-acetyltransferase [Agromyces endophyticus]|uniref:GNAT family N-acetyltransferase n=1 Tax=Agromyces sp. H17E-10 TaxID=2932244 RepID=UPI001FD2255B|nr:GNAT family N-acetyltransferase [Agromyces sp. H17E-10]UOQ90900.1 GNAT family N-acetyltransferase [Agromyces sp. H17E-10]